MLLETRSRKQNNLLAYEQNTDIPNKSWHTYRDSRIEIHDNVHVEF